MVRHTHRPYRIVDDREQFSCEMFDIGISLTIDGAPIGFVFLCLKSDFRTGPSSLRWPECPAYWSLDPTGFERLTTEEALGSGFPSMELTTEVKGWSWDGSVYAGLRQFHRAKGFDPDSQDVARHFEEPLYQLSSEIEPTFAHGQSTVPTNISILT
jgi:hypothetical protein